MRTQTKSRECQEENHDECFVWGCCCHCHEEDEKEIADIDEDIDEELEYED